MNSKTIIILGGVLAAAGVAVYVKKGSSTPYAEAPAAVGQPALKDFKPASIAAISINDGKKSVDLASKEGKWVVVSRDDFPAAIASINEVNDTIFDLKVQQVEVKVSKEELPELGLAEAGGTAKDDEVGKTLVVKDASGKEMASLVVGKTQSPPMTGNVMDMSGPRPTPQWIQVKGVDAVYRTVTGFSKLDGDPKLWLDKDKFFKAEKLKTITVTGPTPEESWKLVREADAGELKLDAPQPGEEFDNGKAAAPGAAFSATSFEDILPAAEKDKAALDKPTHTVVIETFEGLKYTIKVGAKVPPPPAPVTAPDDTTPPPPAPENYYVSFQVEGKYDETVPPYTVPAPAAPVAPAPLAADAKDEDKTKHAEETKKFEEANKKHPDLLKAWEEGKKSAEESFKNQLVAKKDKLATEQALQSRIFVMAKSTLESIMKKRSEMMKEKAAPAPAEGANPGTPGAPGPSSLPPGVKINQLPATPPKPGGKIEAVTPAIEVTMPDKDKSKTPPVPPAEGGKKDATKPPAGKETPKKPK